MATTEYNTISRLSSQARKLIMSTLALHEKYKKSYFWNSPSNASGRRSMEDNFGGKDFILNTKDGKVEVYFDFNVTCSNVYYSMTVLLNGVKKDVRILKKLI